MKVSLIGMSGTGKSYWSKKLKKKGFICFCCDDLIEKKLKKELKGLDYSGINDVAKWIGQPYEKEYPLKSEKYLKAEREVMIDLLRKIKKFPKNLNVVLDTTGSVIHTGEKTMKKLSDLTKIVYLDVPETFKKELFELYLKDQKPVIWGKSFRKEKKENNYEALSRCYPKLLKYREKKYKKYANIILDFSLLKEMNIERFLKLISMMEN